MYSIGPKTHLFLFRYIHLPTCFRKRKHATIIPSSPTIVVSHRGLSLARYRCWPRCAEPLRPDVPLILTGKQGNAYRTAPRRRIPAARDRAPVTPRTGGTAFSIWRRRLLPSAAGGPAPTGQLARGADARRLCNAPEPSAGAAAAAPAIHNGRNPSHGRWDTARSHHLIEDATRRSTGRPDAAAGCRATPPRARSAEDFHPTTNAAARTPAIPVGRPARAQKASPSEPSAARITVASIPQEKRISSFRKHHVIIFSYS